MRTRSAIVLVLLPFVAAGSYIANDLYQEGLLPGFYAPFQKACHDAIALRLVSPTSMKIISSRYALEPIPLDKVDDAIAEEQGGRRANSRAEFNRKEVQYRRRDIETNNAPLPALARVVVEYDASNRLGVPLRGTDQCFKFQPSGNAPKGLALDPHFVQVNGFNILEWQIQQQREAGEP